MTPFIVGLNENHRGMAAENSHPRVAGSLLKGENKGWVTRTHNAGKHYRRVLCVVLVPEPEGYRLSGTRI